MRWLYGMTTARSRPTNPASARRGGPGRWSADSVLAAIRAWAAHTGDAPRSYECSPATARSLGLVNERVAKWERDWPHWPGADTVRRFFGSWSQGLTAAGYPRRPPPELSLRERVEAAARLRANGQTLAAIADQLGVHATTVGTYLRASPCPGCGEPVVSARRCLRCTLEQARPGWEQHEIVDAIRAWVAETGAPPSSTDWGAAGGPSAKWVRERPRWPGLAVVRRRFGSWEAAIDAAGHEPLRRHFTRAQIVAELRRDARRLGRAPRQKEWQRPTSQGPDFGTVARAFGSWTAGLRAAGLEPAQRAWTRDEIVAALSAWADVHGRPPLQPEWQARTPEHPAAATVSRRFGGWRQALQAAGLDDVRPRWGADEVLDAIRAHTRRHGRPPLSSEWRKPPPGAPWPATHIVVTRFGSWRAAVETSLREP
jgi:DNA-binding CsgD family transcriptional regulator